MGTLYIDTGGSATNSGSSDQNAADLSGSAATVAASVVTLDGSPDLTNVDATPGSATLAPDADKAFDPQFDLQEAA